LILAALARLSTRPDLIFYDGNGVLHPRRFGAACHLGLLLDHPVIGVSKNVAAYRPFGASRRGDTRLIESGAGALVTTRADTKPVCVSPGHRIDLASAIDFTLRVSKTRIPEPIRRADHSARSILS
jgi:deoxyribonuclease V